MGGVLTSRAKLGLFWYRCIQATQDTEVQTPKSTYCTHARHPITENLAENVSALVCILSWLTIKTILCGQIITQKKAEHFTTAKETDL